MKITLIALLLLGSASVASANSCLVEISVQLKSLCDEVSSRDDNIQSERKRIIKASRQINQNIDFRLNGTAFVDQYECKRLYHSVLNHDELIALPLRIRTCAAYRAIRNLMSTL